MLFKRKISIIVILLISLVLSSCGSNTNTSLETNISLNQTSKTDEISNTNKEKEKMFNESISEKEMYNYLNANHAVVNLENTDDFSDLTILDDDLKGKEIFLTGEAHGVKDNYKLKMKFLKYFKEKTDFKYYLLEGPYSIGCLYNKFLETGDVDVLDEIFKAAKGTIAWSKQNYNFWKELYEFNETLPQDKRIQVVGVDLEFQITNALRYMYSILPENNAPTIIRDIICEFKSFYNTEQRINNDELKELCERLRKDIEENENLYKEYLGENFFDFNFINNNIINRYEAFSNPETFEEVREKCIYESFSKLYHTLPKGKYYGQWGPPHIYQHEYSIKWFSSYMNDDNSQLHNKILSIVYAYDTCNYMSKGRPVYSEDPFGTFYFDLDGFDNVFNKNHTIFKLNGKDSPFSKYALWPIWGGINSGVTTDYFQYLLVIKNAEATEPLIDQYN